MDGQAEDDVLSRMEWKIEQEKLKLERERITLERERLEAVRERVKAESELRVGQDGRMVLRLSTVAFCSIICLLVGGILGAFSMSVRHDQRTTAQERSRAAFVQEMVQSLSSEGAAVEEAVGALAPPAEGVTNVARVAAAEAAPSPRALQVKTIRPKGGESGISLIVVQ